MKGVIGIFVLGLIMFFGVIYGIASIIERNGGVKAIVIEAGKEMKEISAEIDKHEPTKGQRQ